MTQLIKVVIPDSSINFFYLLFSAYDAGIRVTLLSEWEHFDDYCATQTGFSLVARSPALAWQFLFRSIAITAVAVQVGRWFSAHCCNQSRLLQSATMGCATGLVKAVMFVFNFLFVVAGLGLIAIGATFYLSINTYKHVVDTQFQIAPTLVLIVGIVVFIIAFFGCCGVCKESYCMLVTYAVLLLTLFAIQLAIGIYAYLQVKEQGNNDITPIITEAMEKSFKEYDRSKEVQEFFDVMQRQFHCCGPNGPINYGLNSMNLPLSCCAEGEDRCTIINAYSSGCGNNLSHFIINSVQTVSYVVGGIAAVEVIGALFAICLASTLRNESRRRYP